MSDLLYLECPCTSFPRSFARDYKETYLYPPPSTIYGFLLSLVGEEDLTAHLGVKLAIGIIGNIPPISRIVRKQRHHKFSKTHMGTYPPSQFSKPNFQELLTDLRVVIKLDSSNESATVKLDERVVIALSSPEQITRFGGLSLGESWSLINGIRPYRLDDGQIQWLVKDNRGLIGLPIWIDRQTTRGTFQRFTLSNSDEFDENCWTEIKAPLPATKAKSGSQKKK
ncbi:type I-MYXAN CRISPR-associated protein Cas5/Cmx5/DevS [Crocosphaera sp. UHCC 0190]|uniref:type I-MYXAN CRISPR-associated protein Cas5/Cmx5/DevS n=1 Tax=Crocosphaera sp. UHCC 0190 TaxID=3110246 RepID=UPI002B1FE208|nr:type I-MYXAN CRISPR-associated protein Cas5/Cmx5/DevS [Crocosphaera sp. UHCC 0190]MEA5511748.1 type I-MYXAN CRISPR-associated protein Cas5/Cmx5/DevS [Crocosphaera sp. UHCC 0190]